MYGFSEDDAFEEGALLGAAVALVSAYSYIYLISLPGVIFFGLNGAALAARGESPGPLF